MSLLLVAGFWHPVRQQNTCFSYDTRHTYALNFPTNSPSGTSTEGTIAMQVECVWLYVRHRVNSNCQYWPNVLLNAHTSPAEGSLSCGGCPTLDIGHHSVDIRLSLTHRWVPTVCWHSSVWPSCSMDLSTKPQFKHVTHSTTVKASGILLCGALVIHLRICHLQLTTLWIHVVWRVRTKEPREYPHKKNTKSHAEYFSRKRLAKLWPNF